MRVLYCEFPDDVYFDVGNDVWIKALSNGLLRLGITNVLSFLAGHILKIELKTQIQEINPGQSLATIESAKYFGAIRSPLKARVSGFNLKIGSEPKLVNKSPYDEGWFAELSEFDSEKLNSLPRGKVASKRLEERIIELKVRCFKKLPDKELFSVGSECATTLVNLNDMLEKSPAGTSVHVVSDDPFAEIEMTRWSDQTGNELLETREEGKLVHFLVEKKA